MRNTEEILNDIKTNQDIPQDYSLLEMHCYLCLKKVILMYQNNQLSKEQAVGIKIRINAEYEKQKKEYEFQQSLYKKHIENISNTENLRTRLRKRLNSKEPITEESLCETINLCLELIELYSTEVFR